MPEVLALLEIRVMTVALQLLCNLRLKWYYDQKNSSFFPLDFKTMLTKH